MPGLGGSCLATLSARLTGICLLGSRQWVVWVARSWPASEYSTQYTGMFSRAPAAARAACIRKCSAEFPVR